jgi:RimJ/RimL family protein N-acetyltransferase
VEVVELDFSPEAVNYVWDVTNAPEMQVALPDPYEPYDFVWFMDYWKSGECHLYLPLSDEGKPMGIVWGEVTDADTFEGHYSFFKEFWGNGTERAVLLTIAKIAEQHSVTTFVGSIPIKNKRSLAFAKRIGFVLDKVTTVDRYGKCQRVVKEIQ